MPNGNTGNESVEVSDDERMQSKDECRSRSECRSRGECRRGDVETRDRAGAETKPEEQSSEKSRGANAQSSDKAQRRRGTKPKTGRAPCVEKKEKTIGSARALGARGDCSHAHTRRDAHLASLTPLIGAAQALGCARRARAHDAHSAQRKRTSHTERAT